MDPEHDMRCCCLGSAVAQPQAMLVSECGMWYGRLVIRVALQQMLVRQRARLVACCGHRAQAR